MEEEEPEVEPEPEEPNEHLINNVELKYLNESSVQDLESVVEPVKEQIPPSMSPLVEPVHTSAPTPVLIPPATHLLRECEESAEAVLQPDTEDLDLLDEGSVLMKNMEEDEEEKDGADGFAAPDSIKEGTICEGMSTQQVQHTPTYIYFGILHRFTKGEGTM